MENEQSPLQTEPRPSGRWPWFVGGCALSITSLCSVVLLVLALVSLSLNAYLAWTMSGYQVTLSRAAPVSTIVVAVIPATAAPADTPMPVGTPGETPTLTATPLPVDTPTTLELEYATLAAIGTRVARMEAAGTPTATPSAETDSPPPGEADGPEEDVTGSPAAALQAASSTNVYDLIPIVGNRETQRPDEHGDLNLKLREPQPAGYEAALVDIPGSGIDPDAPQFSSVFQPDFVGTYAVHDWDWGCNCKGNLINDGKAVLIRIKTTPGQPVFIPKTERDIYEGKYYAVVLYASEDSLTVQYARRGSVAEGYTVHYVGLQTDPNLIKSFRESKGSNLPGLTLDVPVGVAIDDLIVAIRDNGTFLDARSRQDWWK
jgi:hypothetical protein